MTAEKFSLMRYAISDRGQATGLSHPSAQGTTPETRQRKSGRKTWNTLNLIGKFLIDCVGVMKSLAPAAS